MWPSFVLVENEVPARAVQDKSASSQSNIRASPEVVVVGIGTSGKAKLASDAELCAKEAKLELIPLPSREAVEGLNRLVEEGKRVSALIHITCWGVKAKAGGIWMGQWRKWEGGDNAYNFLLRPGVRR